MTALRPVPRLFLALVALVALLGMFTVALAPTARAHDVLLESSPADGAELNEVPTELVLTFNNELLDASQAILVTDEAGAPVTEEVAMVDGRTATLALPQLADGAYSVTWSVVSSDGHRIDGELGFTVDAGADEPVRTGSPDEATASPTPPPPDQATTPDATIEDVPAGAAGVPMWVWLVLSVGAFGGIVAIAVRHWRDQG